MTDSQKNGGSSQSDQQQFLSLFLKSEKEIFRYVAALVPHLNDVEDIVQQTAVVLWEKFDQYDPSKPFTPWACRFALNKARQWVERHQRWNALLNRGLAEELAARREELKPQLEQKLKRLDSCLAQLPQDKRALIQAYYYQRSPIAQLAEEAGKSTDATYKLLQRIRTSLQWCIEGSAEKKGTV